MTLKLPAELTEERDFMALYRMTLLGTTAIERDLIETIVALAFLKGEGQGIAYVKQIVSDHDREGR